MPPVYQEAFRTVQLVLWRAMRSKGMRVLVDSGQDDVGGVSPLRHACSQMGFLRDDKLPNTGGASCRRPRPIIAAAKISWGGLRLKTRRWRTPMYRGLTVDEFGATLPCFWNRITPRCRWRAIIYIDR